MRLTEREVLNVADDGALACPPPLPGCVSVTRRFSTEAVGVAVVPIGATDRVWAVVGVRRAKDVDVASGVVRATAWRAEGVVTLVVIPNVPDPFRDVVGGA